MESKKTWLSTGVPPPWSPPSYSWVWVSGFKDPGIGRNYSYLCGSSADHWSPGHLIVWDNFEDVLSKSGYRCIQRYEEFSLFLFLRNYLPLLLKFLQAMLLLPIQNSMVFQIFSGDWKKGLIVKIPKKGTSVESDNWRGICLFPA